MRFRPQLAILMTIAFVATGCIFSPGDDTKPPPPPPPLDTCADSPDAVMQLFRTIYANRDIDSYRAILSRDFLFIPQGEDEDYNYDTEIAVHERMFQGLEGSGFVISNITVDQFERQGVWRETPDNDPNFGGFPDSQYCPYLVDINFSISGQNLVLRVQGPVIYYVRSETIDGETCFRILGQVDNTFGN